MSVLGTVAGGDRGPIPASGLRAEAGAPDPEQELFDAAAGALPAEFRADRLAQFRDAQRARDPRLGMSGAAEPGELPAAALEPDEQPPEPPVSPPAENWVPIGPSGLRRGQAGVRTATSGRTPAIAVAPGGNRVFIGAANGGVWRTDNAGRTWHPTMDAFDLNPVNRGSDSLAVGALALDPADPDRLFVGTGEGAGGAYFGVGPVVTIDGGVSWTTEPTAPGSPSLAGSAFHALAIDPNDRDRVVAATYIGLYRRESDGGGGFHWVRKMAGKWTSVVVASAGTSTTFYASPASGPVQSSTDGHAWSAIGAGFPAAGAGRVGLACQPTNPGVVYALVARTADWHLLGVYRLDASAGAWQQVTGAPAVLFGPNPAVTGQGWYDLAIAVDPTNVNRVYVGGSIVFSGGDWSGALYRCDVTVTAVSASMTPTYIGHSVHGDIHTLQFAPGDGTKLWVGCDGGVFASTNPTGAGDVFVARNTGLATLTMNYLGQHSTEDAVLFCGTQDNGSVRYTGEEAWLYSSGGDGGHAVINWADPYRVMTTYVRGGVNRSTDGGSRYSYSPANVPLPPGEQALFYAPIAGTPPNPGAPAEAELVAFGSVRPWITTDFGTSWASIPTGGVAGDQLNGAIRSLTFASAQRLYAGTVAGGVYRFDRVAAGWTRTQIDTAGGANALPLAGVVTDIGVDPADATGNSVYITFGGTGDYRHVWHFDGTAWAQRSGPAAGSADSLLDVQVNAIAVDPANPAHVYIGADIGAWRSTDGGTKWAPYSQGLPDAAVLDLRLHPASRLLRASTHGRSVWERRIDGVSAAGVELYVRDTQLDQGRSATVNGLPDPTTPGGFVAHWRGPDIKLDTPDATGKYQFPLTGDIDFYEFVDTLTDDFQNVATHATATIVTRVYVQVHNRGVVPADNVRVVLLLANASAGLPSLPAGFDANVRNGTPITSASWRTVGIVTLDGIRAGFPKVAAFSLPSSMLPPPANLSGNQHHCVLALVHHADDPFTSTTTVPDSLSPGDRKAAHKNLHVVQFTGTLPPAAPLVVPFRVNNASAEELFTDLVVRLGGYRGRVRLVLPPVRTHGNLLDSVHGLNQTDDVGDIHDWGRRQLELIESGERDRYDPKWTRQRAKDVRLVLEHGTTFEAVDQETVSVSGIVMAAERSHTVFLIVDRAHDAVEGEHTELRVWQTDTRAEALLGGFDVRVEVVPEAATEYTLRFWAERWHGTWWILRARLYAGDEQLDESDGVTLVLNRNGSPQRMRYHPGWRSFVHYIQDDQRDNPISATALVNGSEVATATTKLG
ncbi:hypothetical protein ILP97_05240 [Amycolatopsis sp. H6(2020)]|nr:hypothetical protein [Amycolatopsis sp. H6(2020)]